jgi:hypothetical protein
MQCDPSKGTVYLSKDAATVALNPPTTFTAKHQGASYVYTTDPVCSWHEYDWLSGTSYKCDPDCSMLTTEVHGGDGVIATPLAATTCVGASDFGTSVVTGVLTLSPSFLRYSCSAN